MEEPIATDGNATQTETPGVQVEKTSAEYLGRWNRLVSTTNWEKGRIIHEWRQTLFSAGAPSGLYSDDAWSRRVGNVSPQHVGRLRRVWERFSQTTEDYPGLYWSHFQAALDWDDAEMWLEGAVQNQWSVSVMRNQRWETLGAVPDEKPDEEPAAAEPDEDATDAQDATPGAIAATPGVVQSAGEETDDGGDDDEGPEVVPLDEPELVGDGPAPGAPAAPAFAGLPELPDDLAKAFDAMKVAIIQHKLAGWTEIGCGHVIAALDALKQLALSPAEQ